MLFTYRFSIRSSYIGGFISFVAQDHIEFDNLAVANRSYRFLWIVLNDSGLMYEHIFLGVVAVDETIATLYIEPLDSSSDFFGWIKKQTERIENKFQNYYIRSIIQPSCGLMLYWKTTTFLPATSNNTTLAECRAKHKQHTLNHCYSGLLFFCVRYCCFGGCCYYFSLLVQCIHKKKRLTLKTCSCRQNKESMQSRAQYRSCVHTQTMYDVPFTHYLYSLLFFSLPCFRISRSVFFCLIALATHTQTMYMVLIIQTKWLRYFYACSVLANYFYSPMILRNSLKLLFINHERTPAHFYCYLFARRRKKPNPRTMCIGLKRHETKWIAIREGEWNLVTNTDICWCVIWTYRCRCKHTGDAFGKTMNDFNLIRIFH